MIIQPTVRPSILLDNNINSQLDATIIILVIISVISTCFRRSFRPSSRTQDCVYSLWYNAGGTTVAPHPCHQQATSSVHYTTSCKRNLVFLRMGETNARNMLSWLKLLIKLLLLHLVGCLYYYINGARSDIHQFLPVLCGSDFHLQFYE